MTTSKSVERPLPFSRLFKLRLQAFPLWWDLNVRSALSLSCHGVLPSPFTMVPGSSTVHAGSKRQLADELSVFYLRASRKLQRPRRIENVRCMSSFVAIARPTPPWGSSMPSCMSRKGMHNSHCLELTNSKPPKVHNTTGLTFNIFISASLHPARSI